MDSVASMGTVVSVRGAVVDVAFDGETLPLINTALIVECDRPEPVRGGDKVFHWSGGDLQSRRSKIQPVVRRSFVLWTKGRRRDVCRGGLRGGSAICFQ